VGDETGEYNGTSWSAGGDLSASRHGAIAAGVQTAAVTASGNSDDYAASKFSTEEYDGTSWSSGGNLTTIHSYGAGGGTQSAAFAAGGTGANNITEEYEAGPGSYDELFTASQGL